MSVHAGDIEEFEAARSAYEARDFERAVLYFEDLVGGEVPRLTSRALILEARKYLGAAYLFVDRREAARRQFELLLREQPNYVLDPLVFPIEVQEVFSSVRERLAADREDEEARAALRSALEAETARAEALIAFAEQEVQTEVANSRWLALLPFGVGQFQNGDDGLGAMFLIAEGLMLVTWIGAAAVYFDVEAGLRGALRARDPDPNVFDQGNAALEAAFGVYWGAIAGLVAFAAVGVLEAQLSFAPVRTATIQRRVPDPLRAPAPPRSSLRVYPTGSGVGATLTF